MSHDTNIGYLLAVVNGDVNKCIPLGRCGCNHVRSEELKCPVLVLYCLPSGLRKGGFVQCRMGSPTPLPRCCPFPNQWTPKKAGGGTVPPLTFFSLILFAHDVCCSLVFSTFADFLLFPLVPKLF